MIGDAHAHGKRHSTRAHGPEYKRKNSKGQSYKHATPSTGKDDTDSGGDMLSRAAARDAHAKGPLQHTSRHHMRDKQAPHKQKERIENKHVDQGQILDEWCAGKRKHYR